MTTKQIGDAAEDVALSFLETNGLQCIERNFSCRMGEIDLIMLDEMALVFVEVRLRSNPHHGSGADTVTVNKMRKIVRTAEFYLQSHPVPDNLDYRFDVISMDNNIDWIQNAFTLDSIR